MSVPRVPSGPPLVVHTERLMLRPLRVDDLDALAPLHAEAEFWRFPLGRGQTREETLAFLERQVGLQATEPALSAALDRAGGELVGWMGLAVPHFLPEILPAVEVGWRLGRRWWGRGLATEGAAAAVRYGFEDLGLDEVVSVYEPANTASGRVMGRLGLTLRTVTTHPTMGMEVHVHALTRADWEHLCRRGEWPH